MIGNLLDVPQGERGPLRDWSLAILGALEPVIPAEVFARGNKAVQEFLAYLEILVARRRAKPGNPERDVLTRLIQGEDNGERLTEKELLHNCIFLLNAGHETTTNLIGNGLVALSQNPAQKQRLIEHPDLIKTAVEEILRFESSNQLGNRMTTETVELGGVELPAGTPVTLCIGAANRDPAQFADPETLDIGRTPNRHLAFATGAHQCAGMALARLEGAIAISQFLARFPDYALDGAPLRGGRARFRGFLHVPCAMGRGGSGKHASINSFRRFAGGGCWFEQSLDLDHERIFQTDFFSQPLEIVQNHGFPEPLLDGLAAMGDVLTHGIFRLFEEHMCMRLVHRDPDLLWIECDAEFRGFQRAAEVTGPDQRIGVSCRMLLAVSVIDGCRCVAVPPGLPVGSIVGIFFHVDAPARRMRAEQECLALLDRKAMRHHALGVVDKGLAGQRTVGLDRPRCRTELGDDHTEPSFPRRRRCGRHPA